MTKGVFIPLEELKSWLERTEADWWLIDSEWGPTTGGIEGALQRGQYPEIASLREFVKLAEECTEN